MVVVSELWVAEEFSESMIVDLI